MPKVRPVPKGHGSITPGLTVTGADAFIRFCKKVFGAKVETRMTGPGGLVMHAALRIGDSLISVADEVPAMGNKSPKTLGGTSVALYLYTERVDAVFKKAVAAGATVRMPVTDMFWGDRTGTVVDPFGHTWSIATHIEDVTPLEMKKRSSTWVKRMAAGS